MIIKFKDERDCGFGELSSSEDDQIVNQLEDIGNDTSKKGSALTLPISEQPARCPSKHDFVRHDKTRATIHSMASSASPDEGYLSPKATIRLTEKKKSATIHTISTLQTSSSPL